MDKEMISRENIDGGWPDCKNVSARFRCASNQGVYFHEAFSGRDASYLVVQITCLLLSLLNNTICFRVFDSHQFSQNSIPIVMKTKFIFNVGATAAYSVTHFYVYKFVNPIQVPNPYICSASLFIAKYFSSASNWTELFSALYRLLRYAFPLQTFRFFRKRFSAYVAITVTLVVPLATGIRLLTSPVALGCYIGRRPYCYVAFTLREIHNTCYVLDYWVPILVVILVILLTPLVIPKRLTFTSQDTHAAFGALRGTYVLSQVSTVVFILFTLPTALCVSLTLLYHDDRNDEKISCQGEYEIYLLFNVMYLLRIASFSADWIVFLFVSRLFRQQFVNFFRIRFGAVRRLISLRP